MTTTIEDTIAQLKPLLNSYLRIHGVIFNDKGFFSCIHPDHNDSDPSCHFVPNTNDTVFRCFGCGATGDLFHAASWLEGLPMHGKEFTVDTLRFLAERLGVVYEPPELNAHDLHVMKLRRLYSDVASLLVRFGHTEHARSRGWTDEVCSRYQVGTVEWEKLKRELVHRYGYQSTFLGDSDIRPALFGEHKLTFTVHNAHGQPVGFAARNLGGDGPKYINTKAESAPIYNKSELLYGLYFARFARGMPTVIVEGYGDVLKAASMGFFNVVASCGTSLTTDHVRALRSNGMNDVVLALDFDEAGAAAMVKALDNVFSGNDGLRLRVFDLERYAEHAVQTTKGQHLDLDEFFDRVPEAVEVFRSQPFDDAFAWRLRHFPNAMEPWQICETSLPFIVNEKSNSRRESMLQILADATGVRIKALQRDLDSHIYAEERQVREATDEIRNGLLSKLRRLDGESMVAVLGNAHSELSKLYSRDIDRQSVDAAETSRSLVEFVAFNAGRPEGLLGFDTGYPQLNAALDGVPKTGALIGVAGSPNVGKSSWVNSLAMQMAVSQVNEDLAVLVMTIDDRRQIFFAKAIAAIAGCTINNVLKPRSVRTQDLRDRMQHAQDVLTWALDAGRLDVKDSSHGSDLVFLDRWLDAHHEAFPNRQCVVILDNFHKLRGGGQRGDTSAEHARFTALSGQLQLWTRQERCTIITTLELRKDNATHKPNIGDVKYTGQLEYDCDAMILLQNQMHRNRFSTQGVSDTWMDDQTREIKPVVRLEFPKNKITDFKGSIGYMFDPARAHFREEVMPEHQEEESQQPHAETFVDVHGGASGTP